MTNAITSWLSVVALVAFLPGCPGEDERLAQMAKESADRQAAQNQEFAQLNREVAQATKELVSSTGQARIEFTELQRDIQAQQAEVVNQLTHLETERRSIAASRMREPLLANVLAGIGSLLIAALPLLLAIYLLRQRGSGEADPIAMNELLIEEFASERPRILPIPTRPPSRIGHSADQPSGDRFPDA